MMFLMLIFLMKFNKINPFVMGILLLFYSLNISMTMSMFSNSYWYSYILFLIMIGGILILFIYFISLIANDEMEFTMNMFFYLFLLFFLIMMYMCIIFLKFEKFNFMLLNNFLDIEPLSKMNFLFKNFNQLSLIKLYSSPSNKITLLIIIYLFFVLISIVKICFINNAPLRKWKY
uniref:NADH-ubiquinone oxidoreductase chain 6 n=1 Tax=Xiphydria sp. ZJUH 2008002 TaxID=2488325 RepID=A0A3G5BC83_9HYME|nr:NADH dehydrogenase subunit 6 [Euxiphydria potanini]AYV97253.1 NADH deshydrogenase subunit 6 [Xiphydria sp. ZJUH 2008002]UYW35405.1 NADH dehydrogenase subunit 6 [Euxiphydria potanini]